ncbi:hypothetical protein NKR19_g4406 [Coniochaeta hoffmannii]|uniref:Aldehyde dehydrogenase domain-containing protein n=1 Tax=Coniochaeta hoffmannii TaxID=91930 RepID=A0AA38S408_9PEZI|nr:hypothetical protein NKR19_g4406 [Coniochaeta hoffmannii]
MATELPTIPDSLPSHKDLFYDDQWHPPSNKQYRETYSPGNGQVIDLIADAGAEDVDRAVQAARLAFESWRSTPASQRADGKGHLESGGRHAQAHADQQGGPRAALGGRSVLTSCCLLHRRRVLT